MAKEIIIRPDSSAAEKFSILKGLLIEGLKGGPISVVISRLSKTRAQEKKFNAMIVDIQKQVLVYGKSFEFDTWKAKLVFQFEQELHGMGLKLRHPGRITTSIDGQHMISIRPSTKKFSIEEGSMFIEFLYMQGVEMNVNWPAKQVQIAAAERQRLENRRAA
jgi:hypothetical protein